MATTSRIKPLSGLVIRRAVTIGVGTLPGIIPPMAGIPAGTILGIITAGAIRSTMVITVGVIPSIMEAVMSVVQIPTIVLRANPLAQVVTASAMATVRPQVVVPSVPAMVVARLAQHRAECPVAATMVRLAPVVLPQAAQARLVVAPALVAVVGPLEAAEAVAALVAVAADLADTGNRSE